MLTDRISDFLTRIRNAARARRESVTVKSSKVIRSIAQVLVARGFVAQIRPSETKGEMIVILLPSRADIELKRVSKPGQRIYVGFKDVKRVKNGLGLGIISTSSGILPDDEVRKRKVGGEYLCKVW